MSVIRWRNAAILGLTGLSLDEAQEVASRWCGTACQSPDATSRAAARLEVPTTAREHIPAEPHRIRIGARVDDASRALELRVGPHRVKAGHGDAPDVVEFSNRRAPSRLELGLLIDLGINHLLARQGLPVLHAGAFVLGERAVLGLGDSFSGKTTASVAAMVAGGRVVSDDLVLTVPDADDRCSLVPVRSYGWLRDRTREIVPSDLLQKMVENEENGRPRWVLNREDGGESFVDRATPDVIWVQGVDRRLKDSRIEAITHGQAFAALIRASSPIYLSRHCPEIRDRLIPVFRALCAQCRAYRVRLGRRLLEDPAGEIARLVELSR